MAYARTLALKGQRQSYRMIVTGWILLISAGACAVLATTAKGEASGGWFNSNIGIYCGAGAIILAGIGWQCLDRATAAALLASAATRALLKLVAVDGQDADQRVYEMCVEAKAGWLEGRMNHDRVSAIASRYFPEVPSHAPPAQPVGNGTIKHSSRPAEVGPLHPTTSESIQRLGLDGASPPSHEEQDTAAV